MFTWAKVVLLALQIIRSFVQFANERNLLTEIEHKALSDAFQRQQDDLQKARHARDLQRADNRNVPANDSLPNDGFRRD